MKKILVTLTLVLLWLATLAPPALALTAPVLSLGTVTSTTAMLSWTDPNTDETSYEVTRYAQLDCTGFIASLASLPANTTTYTAMNLTPNTTYTICVSAKKGGQTKKSNSVRFTTGTGTTTTTTTTTTTSPPATTTTTPPPTTTTTTSPPTTTTTTPPPTTTTTTTTVPPPACVGTTVPVGTTSSQLQTLINNAINGTTFCFESGTYNNISVSTGTKAGLVFDLRAGTDPDAVIDGQGIGALGFNGADGIDAPDYLGGVFQNYGNAVGPDFAGPIIVRDDGQVIGTEFRNNFSTGLAIQGDRAFISGVFTHHNGRYGMTITPVCQGCAQVNGVVIENSEVSFNNTRQLNPGGDAGGTKFVANTNTTVRFSDFHNNFGSGIWFDGCHTGENIHNNMLTDNHYWGIFYEQACGATATGSADIHDNVLLRNGETAPGQEWFNSAQLLVSCANGGTDLIEVYNNQITGAKKAMGFVNHPNQPADAKNIHFFDNTVTLTNTVAIAHGQVGGYNTDTTATPFAPASNIRFFRNSYIVTAPIATMPFFGWADSPRTWSQWQGFGQDLDGTIQQAA